MDLLFLAALLGPFLLPLACFLLGWWYWRRPFVRQKRRAIAWYYGALGGGAFFVLLGYLGDAKWIAEFAVSICSGMAVILWPLGVPLGLWVLRGYAFAKPAPPQACSGCRYDLTGNTSGVCPECGLRIPGHQRKLLHSLANHRKRSEQECAPHP